MHKISRNTALKLLAFLCAIVLWFYVAIFQNPITSINVRNIPINFSNMSVITSKNLVITSENNELLDLKIGAPRSSISKLNNKNITATIDLSAYAKKGEYDIPIQISLPINDATISSQNLTTIHVVVDTTDKRSIPITVITTGTAPDGETNNSISISPQKITVDGPKSILDLIDHAAVNIDWNNVGSIADIKLYSSTGDEIINDLLTLSDAQVQVSVQ